MKTETRYFGVVAAMVFAFVAFGAQHHAYAQDKGVYTVAKLAVDMRAKDAVTAKMKALAAAKRQALRTVLRRIAPFNSSERFPVVSDKAIDDMLEGFAVQRERNSPTRYLATLDFSFNAEEVRKLLIEKGIALSEQQADRITVLPVYIVNGKIDHTGRDPWRAAWNGLDLKHAIVPVKLARAGPSLTIDALSSLLGGDPKAFVTLREKVNAEKLVLAIAEPTADGKTLTTRLFGFDRVGAVGLTRHDPVAGGNMRSAADYAASVSLGIFEGRWKLMHAPSGGAEGGGELEGIDIIVEFSGMGQWKDMRARLVKVPGLSGLDVKSISARTAQVGLQFPGGAERLAQVLVSHGLSLDGGGEKAWVLRGN